MTFIDYTAIASQDNLFNEADAWAELQAIRQAETAQDGEMDASTPEDELSDPERWALEDVLYRGEYFPEW